MHAILRSPALASAASCWLQLPPAVQLPDVLNALLLGASGVRQLPIYHRCCQRPKHWTLRD